LVTDIATFPIGFRFYVPNPAMSAWRICLPDIYYRV
jgi:hypothetical protein